jgi:hypothetical protein
VLEQGEGLESVQPVHDVSSGGKLKDLMIKRETDLVFGGVTRNINFF